MQLQMLSAHLHFLLMYFKANAVLFNRATDCKYIWLCNHSNCVPNQNPSLEMVRLYILHCSTQIYCTELVATTAIINNKSYSDYTQKILLQLIMYILVQQASLQLGLGGHSQETNTLLNF